MMKFLSKYLLVLLLFKLSMALKAQDCLLPFVVNYSERDTTSIRIHWVDNNTTILYWEIELGEPGFTQTFSPTTGSINTKNFKYNNLEPGVRYEFYLRAACEQGLSDWNGPYFFNTNIKNQSDCNLNLPIEDNNCPAQTSFYIATDLDTSYVLGKDIYLEAVDISIKHPWTPDLYIQLESPSGKTIDLFNNRGIHNSNLGLFPDSTCTQTLRFTEIACSLLADGEGPYVGEFQAEESINIFNDGVDLANGVWSLNICDRAFGDVGELAHIGLIFSEELCQLPENIFISDIDGEEITVSWDANNSCQDVKLTYGPIGFDPNQATIDFVECPRAQFTIRNLEPGTTYELFFESICENNLSLENCPLVFTTACGVSTLTSSFDEFDNCTPNCNRRCFVPDSVWHNSTDNRIDWIVFSGATPSSFTGPSSDVNNLGSYVYLESQPEACGNSYSSSFESNCLTIGNYGNDCGISFFYHMFGQNIDSLKVEINVNQDDRWELLWSTFGNQGDQWIPVSLDLMPYEGTTSRIRFVAKSNGGNLGDIAIDQIKLFGSVINEDLFTFYEDADADGFGNENSELIICQSDAPNGFVTTGGDCNDLRSDIFPGANEFPCNLVDENCNGMEDDETGNNIDFIVELNAPATCAGINNGALTIIAFGGTGNYKYAWNNGEKERDISSLATGIYQCTITDLIGCVFITDPIFVGAIETLSFAVVNQNPPQCTGIDNGNIELLVGGGTPPYEVNWNTGQQGALISDLKEGFYSATISDFFGCNITVDTIALFSDPEVIPGIQIKNNASCFDSSDGSLLANVSGGRPPYEFLWSNGDTTSFTGNLEAGSYDLSVTDTEGCIGVLNNIEVEQADSLQIILDAVEQIRCFGEENGRIEITVLGGNPPYTYFWSDNNFTSDRINVPSGIYNLTVSDSKSCSAIMENITIPTNTRINVSVDEFRNVDCIGSSNGFIKIKADGGKPPYLYNWSNGSQLDSLENLSAGKYSVTVIDQFECKSILRNLEVKSQNLPVDLNIEIIEDIACFGDTSAIISASIENALPPFDFNWSVGEKNIKVIPRDTILNISAGVYALTVTDNNGCIGLANDITTQNPPELVYAARIEQSDCFESNNAFIDLDIEGGIPPYAINWAHGDIGNSITFLEDGLYAATVSDKNNCLLFVDDIIISSPEELIVDASIFGSHENEGGRISLFVTGGTVPYSYFWEGPNSLPQDSTLTNLISGTYKVTVEDTNGCTFSEEYVIDNTTNTNELSKALLSIHPNPTRDEVSFISNKGILSIDLIDLSGRHYVLNDKDKQFLNLSLKHIYPGLYFVLINFEDGSRLQEKLIVLEAF